MDEDLGREAAVISINERGRINPAPFVSNGNLKFRTATELFASLVNQSLPLAFLNNFIPLPIRQYLNFDRRPAKG